MANFRKKNILIFLATYFVISIFIIPVFNLLLTGDISFSSFIKDISKQFFTQEFFYMLAWPLIIIVAGLLGGRLIIVALLFVSFIIWLAYKITRKIESKIDIPRAPSPQTIQNSSQNNPQNAP